MNWTLIMLLFWSASAALGAFLFVVVKPKLRAFEQRGRSANEHIWELMDSVAQRHARLKLLGPMIVQEQRAFDLLRGSASLLALERSSNEFRQAGFLLVALEVDAGLLEGELQVARTRYGWFFYHCFLRSSVQSSYRIIAVSRAYKESLLKSANSAQAQATGLPSGKVGNV